MPSTTSSPGDRLNLAIHYWAKVFWTALLGTFAFFGAGRGNRTRLFYAPTLISLGLLIHVWVRGWEAASIELESVLFYSILPPVLFGVVVLGSKLFMTPWRGLQVVEEERDALKTELQGLVLDPEAPPLVKVEGLQELGPQFRITSLIDTERMQVRVSDWDDEYTLYDTDAFCYLKWDSGSTAVRLAQDEPAMLLLGHLSGHGGLSFNSPGCPAFEGNMQGDSEGNGNATDTYQWRHDVCLRFTAPGHRSQSVWVRLGTTWSVYDDEAVMTAHATSVLPDDYVPSR